MGLWGVRGRIHLTPATAEPSAEDLRYTSPEDKFEMGPSYGTFGLVFAFSDDE